MMYLEHRHHGDDVSGCKRVGNSEVIRLWGDFQTHLTNAKGHIGEAEWHMHQDAATCNGKHSRGESGTYIRMQKRESCDGKKG